MMTVNLAVLLAQLGHRVGLVDLDLQSPTTREMLGVLPDPKQLTLHDYLFGQCGIAEIAYVIQPQTLATAGAPAPPVAPIFTISGSTELDDIAALLRAGYDPQRLIDGFQQIRQQLQLDYLLIDTHPGLGEEALLAIAMCDVLLMLLLPDPQSIQQGAVSVEVARKLGVTDIFPVMNLVLDEVNPEEFQAKIREVYGVTQTAWVPFSEDFALLGKQAISGQAPASSPLRDFLQAIAIHLAQTADNTVPREISQNGTQPLARSHTLQPRRSAHANPGLKLSDLVNLPIVQQRLLSWMMRQQDVTRAEIDQHCRHSEVDVAALIDTLIRQNYIYQTNDTPPRYRVKFAPKTQRTGTTDLWRVLDDGEDTS